MSGRLQILNGAFDVLTMRQAIAAAFARTAGSGLSWLATVNVSMLMAMRKDRALQDYVDRAALVVADGQPIVWCSPLFGRRLPERVAGIDLMDALCGCAAREGIKVFLLGGTSELLPRALANLRRRHPGLDVEGCDGYFAPDEAAERADRIRASGAPLLLVGMGSPRQEHFILDQGERSGARLAVGVGGSFDVIAGRRRRAPPWMQGAGLEWLFRLVQEPRRLAPRYIKTNSQFCCAIARHMAGRLRRRA